MFDFDEIPEDLGGANRGMPELADSIEHGLPSRLFQQEVSAEEELLWEVAGGRGSVGVALARHARPGRAPLCVLVVPGTPLEGTGGARMTDPMYTELVRMCWGLGIPTVRFDYRGFGRGTGTPSTQAMLEDAAAALGRALAECGDRLVILAHSGGNTRIVRALCALPPEVLRERVAAYVNVNWGIHPLGYLLADDDLTKEGGERLHRQDVELFGKFASRFEAPVLFVCGTEDRLTRPEYCQQIVDRDLHRGRSRPARLAVLPGKHAFPGEEEELARTVRLFLLQSFAGEFAGEGS